MYQRLIGTKNIEQVEIALLILAFVLNLSYPCEAQGPDSLIEKIQKSLPSLVAIKTLNKAFLAQEVAGNEHSVNPLPPGLGVPFERSGAGVIIDTSGLIVTNAHLVYQAQEIRVTCHDGHSLPADVVSVVPQEDLAFLRITSFEPLPVIPMADSDLIELNDDVINVGNSDFLKETISGGKVIGVGTSHQEQLKGNKRVELIQTNINLYKGDSGGPLLDSKGRLIGLMVAKELNAERSSFAIPVNKIRKYGSELMKTKTE